MESFTLTTPETIPAKTTTTYKVIGLNMQWEVQLIVIHLRGTNGEIKEFRYGDDNSVPPNDKAKATTLMTALNKANLPVKSLHKRILEQLVTDFPTEMAGTITGTPD